MEQMINNTLLKHNIGIFSYGRTQSQRCPNKMLRGFDQTTIADILLKKFSEIGGNTFFAGHDQEFKIKCEEHGVDFVQRTLKSVTIDEPQTECLSFLHDVEYDYLLLVNGCLPFLKQETILKEIIKISDTIDVFFKKITVNHEDDIIKNNRLMLLVNLRNIIIQYSKFSLLED